MENVEESVKETSKDTMGFFRHVFKMDSDEKGTILNIMQYTILSMIPVLLVLKLIRTAFPEADDEKGSLVILAEVIGQIFVMFLSIYFIHRMIVYIPTFSGIKYSDFNLTNLILGFLMIILTIQTKLGEKVHILVERVQSLWEGNTTLKEDKNKEQQGGNNVRVTQPLSQPSHIPSQADYLGTSPIPPPAQMTSNHSMTNEYALPQQPQQQQQQDPNFNAMYSNDTTPLVDAQTPSAAEYQEPMAANGVLGGGFGSAF